MAKLLFIFEADMPSVSITRDIYLHLNNKNVKSTFMCLSEVRPSDIDYHDIIIFIRPTNIYSCKIAQKARAAGHLVVTTCDDDLLNRPKGTPRMPWRKKGLIKCLSMSDVIWSTSQYILDDYKYMTRGKRTAKSDTILSPSELKYINTSNNNNEVIKIVYAAGSDHEQLFERYIKPIVPDLLLKFGDSISFTFIGVHPEMGKIKCKYVSMMPLDEYRKFMREHHFDIGLAPLHQDKFSKCKYFNKFIEYTMQGIMGIYSNTEPYTYVIKDGENGLLADNNPQSWLEVIGKAIENKKLREECIRSAIKYLRTNHSEKVIMGRLKEEIPEIFQDTKSYVKCGNFRIHIILHNFFRKIDLLYLIGFYLREKGLIYVINRVKRKFFHFS